MISNIFKYISIALSACLLILTSCESEGIGDKDSTSPEYETVPEGVLRLFADKTVIKADGSDAVTFRVMYGSEDVSNARGMHLVRIEGEKETDMASGANSFTTASAGTYTFKAYLYRSGDIYSDNSVVVTATPVESAVKWHQKTVALQFTAVGCTSCPSMSQMLMAYQQQYPGELIAMAFHTNFQISDPMYIDVADTYHSYFKLSGYPSGVLNFRGHSEFKANSDMQSLIAVEKNEYPSTCGVALETSYDSASRKAEVIVKVTSSTPSRYKYHIFLLEDGIEYMQAGVTGNYIHNNVVRYRSAPDITGTNMNDRKDFTPGQEVKTMARSIDIPSSWNPAKLKVVGIAMSSPDNGTTWECNNAAVCALGVNSDYEYLN